MKTFITPVALRALTLGMVLSVAVGAPARAQATPPDPAASAAGLVALRQALAEPLLAAQEALKAKDGARAMSQIRTAEQLPDLTPTERYYIARTKVPAAVSVNDYVAALQALELSLSSALLPVADRMPLLELAVPVAARVKANDRVEALAREYLKQGGGAQTESVRTQLVQVLNQRGAYADLLTEVNELIAADERAGRKVAEIRWKLKASAQIKLKDEAAYAATLEKLVQNYPSVPYWRDLVSRTESQKGFAERLTLESFRLLRQVGALVESDEYLGLAELAQRAGQPSEALAVLEEGIQAKRVATGADAAAHLALRDKLAKASADDRSRLAGSRADAEKAKDGSQLVALGQAHASLGQWDTALALMAQGLQRGVTRQPDDARLRYAATLIAAGQRDKALPVLETVRGEDGTAALARLWSLVSVPR